MKVRLLTEVELRGRKASPLTVDPKSLF